MELVFACLRAVKIDLFIVSAPGAIRRGIFALSRIQKLV